LVDNYGVDIARLSSAGVGYLAPAATNDTEEGRGLNRRVELIKDN
jgi:outer membrane protein OmpA-like peptidoglycan-associated protein